MINIQINKQQQREIERILGSAARASRVYKRAVSDTVRKGISSVSKQATESLQLKKKTVKKYIKKGRSTSGLSAIITVSGSQVRLIEYYLAKGSSAKAEAWIYQKPINAKKPISVNVRKGKTEVHPNAFFVKYKSGKLDIAQRAGTRRFPLRSKFGASVRQGFEQSGKNVRIEDDLTKYMQQRVAAQMQLILEGKRR